MRPHVVFLLPLALACDSTAPRESAGLRISSGDGQVGRVGTTLAAPLVITVTDKHGAAVRGTRVRWTASAGQLAPNFAATDEGGHAQAWWTLGLAAGALQASAEVAHLPPVVFGAKAVSPRESPPPLPYGRLYLLNIPTYDGSGQVVHPDYAASAAGLLNYPGHLAITPYPFGNPHWENPSVFAAAGSLAWLLEDGAPNPVLTPGSGYLSDPDLVYVETGELWLYYRQVNGSNLIYLVRSVDGIHWTTPVQVAGAPNHEIISPTVVHRGPNDWWMWAINGGAAGCDGATTRVEVRHSEDGQHWSPPGPVELTQPGFFPWHLDVQWIPTQNQFWAIYNVKMAGSCTTPAVFLATSPDGVNWTPLDRPVLAKGSVPAFAHVVYRSTFSYDPVSDDIVFWYSGARYDGNAYIWSAAVQRRARGEVFGLAEIGYDPGPLLVPAPAPLEEWP